MSPEQILRSGVDVVVGTPGRILDFTQKGTLDLSKLKHMVLDEVDRMLDMGFADTVDEILQYAYTPGKLRHRLIYGSGKDVLLNPLSRNSPFFVACCVF